MTAPAPVLTWRQIAAELSDAMEDVVMRIEAITTDPDPTINNTEHLRGAVEDWLDEIAFPVQRIYQAALELEEVDER